MDEGEIVLGKVNLNAYEKKDKDKTTPSPVIELMAYDGALHGEIVVLKCLRSHS